MTIDGVAKFDLTAEPLLTAEGEGEGGVADSRVVGGCMVGFYSHGEGRRGSEPVFVPRPAANGGKAAEDDGYLLNFVYDERTE